MSHLSVNDLLKYNSGDVSREAGHTQLDTAVVWLEPVKTSDVS